MKSVFPLILLGAGAWFLAKPKNNAEKANSGGKGIVTGSKERGYIITNCNLVIYDEQKAFDYVYSLGVEEAKKGKWNTPALKFNLFGDCLSNDEKGKQLMNTKEKALFIFNLHKFVSSGVVSIDESFTKDKLDSLTNLKTTIAKVLGIDTSDFKVELVKKT
jgi:hypothetical protein